MDAGEPLFHKPDFRHGVHGDCLFGSRNALFGVLVATVRFAGGSLSSGDRKL
jgi:hypothetical protein